MKEEFLGHLAHPGLPENWSLNWFLCAYYLLVFQLENSCHMNFYWHFLCLL